MIEDRLPWIQAQAITALDKHVAAHPGASVLEFGMGGSSLWFSDNHCALHSADHNPQWLDRVKSAGCKFETAEIMTRPYSSFAERFAPNTFDIVFVDGRDRVECVKASVSVLKPGGMLMLDNSERPRYRPIFEMLSRWKQFNAKGQWSTTWWFKP